MNNTFQNIPLLPFPNVQSFETWLSEHHTSAPAIWVKFYKKASGIPSITYDEALDVALCYGWIDSQMKSLDEKSYIQKFGPRKSRSPWSEINKGHIERLIKEGRMKAAGLAAVEAAKANGQWDSAYASPTTMVPPREFMQALQANRKAHDFFESLGKTQRFYFLYRIVTAKRPETKEKRIKEAIKKLARGEKMNP